MSNYKPEGMLIDTAANKQAFHSLSALQEAHAAGRILESRAIVCDSQHNLIVDMGAYRGMIPREEGALGISDGSTRDIAIISRVNKPVCYRITGFSFNPDGVVIPLLSRRAVQQECMDSYITKLTPGDVIDARVTHLEAFGCFVDIGCGIPSLIPIDSISVLSLIHIFICSPARCGRRSVTVNTMSSSCSPSATAIVWPSFLTITPCRASGIAPH